MRQLTDGQHSSPQREAPRAGGIVLMALSSGASLLLSLGRTKLVALVLGPAGIGLLGLVQSTMATAALIGGAGLDSIVTREAAKARSTGEGLATSIGVGLRGAWALGLVTALGAWPVFVFFGPGLGVEGAASFVAVPAAIACSIAGANARALVAGLASVTQSAFAAIASAVGALVLSAVVLAMVKAPLGVAVALVALAIPAAQVVATSIFVSRAATSDPLPWGALWGPLRWYLREAGGFAIAGVVPVLTQLVARSLVREHTSEDQFGFFQASLALGTTVTSVLAASVGASVLPSLSRVSASPAELRLAVDQSAKTYLVLFAPMALAVAVFPVEIVGLLYTAKFSPVAEQLSWQLMGEVVRLPAWVLSSVLIVRGRSRRYLVVEILTGISLIVGLWVAGTSSGRGLGLAVAAAAFVQFGGFVLLTRSEGVSLSTSTWSVVFGLVLVVAATAAFSSVPAVRWACFGLFLVSGVIAFRTVALERLRTILRR